MTRKNIKLKKPLFERLKADKPDTMSWPRYFEEQCLEASPDAEPRGVGVDGDVVARLERIEALTRESAEAAQSAKRGVEELDGGR